MYIPQFKVLYCVHVYMCSFAWLFVERLTSHDLSEVQNIENIQFSSCASFVERFAQDSTIKQHMHVYILIL